MKLVIDTSALIAMVRGENEARSFVTVIGTAVEALISASTVVEAAIATTGKGDEARRLGELIDQTNLRVVPFSREEASVGFEAFVRFGKGGGHPARLNMGDCFSYALGKTRSVPLLFKGDDFIHTDIEPALEPA